MSENLKLIPKDDPYEILRVYRDEAFTRVPSSDDVAQRARYNELIQATSDCLDDYDRRTYRTTSNKALADLLHGKPNALVIEEAVRRLKGNEGD